MNETVTIKEGGLTRRLAPIDKLKVNTTANTESLWVPAERGNTGVLYASENGIYIASEDGYESYSEVVVRVTEESFYGDKDFDHWDYEVPTDFPDLWDSLTLDDFNVDPLAFDDLFNNKDVWDMDIPDLPDKLDFKIKDLKTKKQKKEKITGIDPVSGNEMAVGLDNFGRLTEEIVPTSISVITPPSKLIYKDGESIQFGGLVVQAYTADGNVWTDNNHPNGIIPMGELFFPVTVATWSGDNDGIHSNSQGLNVLQVTFGASWYHQGWGNFYLGPVLGTYPEQPYWGHGGPLNIASDNQGTVYITLYNGQVYTYGIGSSGGLAGCVVGVNHAWFTGYGANYWMHNDLITPGTYMSIPNSGVDPTKADLEFDDVQMSVPVQWFRPGDGQMLETSFEITVTKGEGGSSGGGDTQAITYNGTRYVANEDMNAEAHYQSGTVWIRGEGKVWSVQDAVAFGLLKPEEEKDGGSDSGSEHEGGHF
jgi:hypothetical protein